MQEALANKREPSGNRGRESSEHPGKSWDPVGFRNEELEEIVVFCGGC